MFLGNARELLAPAAIAVSLSVLSFNVSFADHNGLHATACDLPNTVGGGALGNSPGPVGPPNSLGWDVGGGQCNGSFSTVTVGDVELGLRAEQRRVGQVAPTGPNDYTVQPGPDTTGPVAINRAWWNFQGSIAVGSGVLDSLTLEILTDVGPNDPSAPSFDLLALGIDARNNQPNPTTGFGDLYQFSQNPEFGWFSPAVDGDGNPTGAFDYDEPGAWRFRLTAVKGPNVASLTVCIHTPGQFCDADDDGVNDGVDQCLNTQNDSPTEGLGTNRWIWTGGTDFVTEAPKGKGPGRSYTMADTAGCSCTQIIEAQGLGKGHSKFGCSISAMDDWVANVNP